MAGSRASLGYERLGETELRSRNTNETIATSGRNRRGLILVSTKYETNGACDDPDHSPPRRLRAAGYDRRSGWFRADGHHQGRVRRRLERPDRHREGHL